MVLIFPLIVQSFARFNFFLVLVKGVLKNFVEHLALLQLF
jgi:hypothetical protein